MTATECNSVPDLSCDWCKTAWVDPLTGARVVRLSPDDGDSYVTAYFRIRHFTSDGRTMLMAGRHLIALDLVTGEYRNLGTYVGGSMGISYACATRGRVAHLIVREGDHEEIERVDLDTGERVRTRPSRDFAQIYDPGCTADGRYILAPDNDRYPHGRPPHGAACSEAQREMQRNPGIGRYYRIDIETGETEEVLAMDRLIFGHPNPNPVYPHLFMCSRIPVMRKNNERLAPSDEKKGQHDGC